jgi:hypothetical protein
VYHKPRRKSPSRTRGVTTQQTYGLPLPWYTVCGTKNINKHQRDLKDGDLILTYDTPDERPAVVQYDAHLDVCFFPGTDAYLLFISSYMLLPSPAEVNIPPFSTRKDSQWVTLHGPVSGVKETCPPWAEPPGKRGEV